MNTTKHITSSSSQMETKKSSTAFHVFMGTLALSFILMLVYMISLYFE